MKTAICYFSGTGNSLDIANKLTNTIAGELFFIPRITDDDVAAFDRVIIIAPIYSFGIPIPVKAFIESMKNFTSKEYHVILHYGGFSGNAANYTKMYFESCGLQAHSIHKMKMPENFTVSATVPPFYIRKALNASGKQVNTIAKSINNGEKKIPRKNIFAFCDGLHEKNAAKWASMSENFIVTDRCPGAAINYGEKTIGKARYQNPNVDFSKMEGRGNAY